MKRKFHIGVAIEQTSEYGRRFLQGVADFFDGKPDCQLALLNPSQVTDRTLDEHDGWICRITDKRILAKRLLRTTAIPIKDIAAQTGYQSIEYFTRAFKAAVGYPPAAYRLTGTLQRPRSAS